MSILFQVKKLVRSSIHIQLLTETIAHPMLLLTVSLWTGFQCSTIFIISHLTWLLLTKWPFHDKSLIGSRFLVAQPLFICLELLKSEWTDRKRILQSSSPRCNVPSEVSPAVRYIGSMKMVSLILRAICIKVFEWWSAIQTTSKKESWNGWSIHNSIDMPSYYQNKFNISILLIYYLNKYKICWSRFVMRTRNYFIVTLQREVTVLAQFD